MSIHQLSSLAQDAIGLVARVLADVDVWTATLFCNGEVLSGLVNCDRSNTVGVQTIVSLGLLGVKVVGLVLVASDVDDKVVLKEVHVVALGRLLRHQVVEARVSAGDL